MKNKIGTFSSYVLRTPLLPLSFYIKLTSDQLISDQQLKQILQEPIIREAIFLASPSLFEELKKWESGEVNNEKSHKKLKYSLLKYISRLSSRCTPFGLFAGCSIGTIGDNTKITLEGPKKNNRKTRFDMNYLVALSQDLQRIEKVKDEILFYPNSSIYSTGENIRYVEYQYIGAQRHHRIISVDNTYYLQKILNKASEGALLNDLIDFLIKDDVSVPDAKYFIEELVMNQILISELEPSISGPDFLAQIVEVLDKIKFKEISNSLKVAKKKLDKLDTKIGNLPEQYLDLSKILSPIGTGFKLKYLFQTDLFVKAQNNNLDKNILNQITKGLLLFNKITYTSETELDRFRKSFQERYGEREVSLAVALDTEIGIGYKKSKRNGDYNPLVDDLVLPSRTPKSIDRIKWNPVNRLIYKKLLEAYIEKCYTLVLKEEDFSHLNENWEDLPDTFSSMIEIVNINGKEMITMGGAGGSSGANLLGRFCYGDKEIKNFTEKISNLEDKMNGEKVLAEIIHLPESRVGNVLMRPDLRQYEIPYLAKSVLPKAYQLSIDDLFISIKNGNKILLRSRKLNKEVLPHLTNAHNYSKNSLPIYNFLCDLQFQDKRGSLGFNFGPLTEDFEFIPRIEFGNLILHEASWTIKKDDIQFFKPILDNDLLLSQELKKFRKLKNIPQHVMLKEGDNELLLNLENLTVFRMLYDLVKNRTRFKIKEFLFTENGVVKGSSKADYYTNQIIISFYNKSKLKNA